MARNSGDSDDLAEGPWNPDIRSELTRELLTLSSIFRPENVFRDLRQAIELRDVTGLELEDLAMFRPERMALHELLVRVTSDYEVPDPEDASIDSLGINLRRMTQRLGSRVIAPYQSDLGDVYRQHRDALGAFIRLEISSAFDRCSINLPGESGRATRRLRSWFRKPTNVESAPARESEWDRDERILGGWIARLQSSEDPLHAAALRSLVRVASSIRVRHGRILGEHTFLAEVGTDLACNQYGSELIGQYLEPLIRRAAEEEGFRQLPAQAQPVAMTTKGASASGKSTMRPLQRKLAAKMGLQWSDFALISPDTWRKALLNFDALGPLYKYAGMLTSQEVAIIDKKLDAHLVRKGETRRATHVLVDRFRFDSFAPDSEENKHLPSQFGELLCYFFMITPPEKTVERAWLRGLEIGRYKAVDDLLAHNRAAFSGMQDILFGRTLDPKIRIHYELLDNNVARGEVPLTIAFGWSGEMNVLDAKCMVDMERYRKININAKRPAEVYPDQLIMAVESNVGFLARCVRKYPQLNFADRDTGRVYASFVAGRLEWMDPDALASAIANVEVRAILYAAAPEMCKRSVLQSGTQQFLQPDRYHTIGRWGTIR